MDEGGFPHLPDSILLEVFLHLEPQDVLAAGTSCKQWCQVSRDEFLWKEIFYRYYNVNRSVPRHPAATSWLGEFRRLFDTVPCVEVEVLKEHRDQVLHVSFSHSGYLFGSCSKDCFVKVWNNDLEITVLHSANMRPYNWSYTQFSQFNAEDTLLLVSGVYIGPRNSSSGEIAVFNLDDFTLLSRVRNKPYDVFGCWLNETHLISGNLYWIGNMTSCSVLWLNKAFQDIESENLNVVKRLFQLQNLNASTIRTVMVADCKRHETPDLLLDYDEQQATSSCRVFDLGSDSEDEDGRKPMRVLASACEENKELERVKCEGGGDKQIEARFAKLFLQAKTKVSDIELLEKGHTEEKKFLIFTTGSLTYTPHQIGIKQILAHQMSTTGPVLGEERGSNEFFDPLDYTFDVHGHIIGMGLSPDNRYLYVNSRAWPKGCVISDPMNPPPIAEEIDLHVFDLKTMREVTRTLRAHRAYTPNDECFFIFLDVSKDYVASGAEDQHGYIWDRHYNICLAKLQHQDVVNSVAFSSVDQEMLITASDDCTLKVWRSPRVVRIMHAKPKPKKLSFFWLNNKKSP
uniref:F-box and WD repeat domain containing 5 n=1 Tax=Callorhinchus milii TaxID=7868 RepID=A0A4W3JDS7_CALMI